MSGPYDRAKKFVRLMHGVPYSARVTLPSGATVNVFTPRQLEITKALVSSRFDYLTTASSLHISRETIKDILFGGHRSIGVMKKLELWHEQNAASEKETAQATKG